MSDTRAMDMRLWEGDQRRRFPSEKSLLWKDFEQVVMDAAGAKPRGRQRRTSYPGSFQYVEIADGLGDEPTEHLQESQDGQGVLWTGRVAWQKQCNGVQRRYPPVSAKQDCIRCIPQQMHALSRRNGLRCSCARSMLFQRLVNSPCITQSSFMMLCVG